MKRRLTPIRADAGRPLSDCMMHRDRVAHEIFHNFVTALFIRYNLYHPGDKIQVRRKRDDSVAVFLQIQHLLLG